MKKIRMTLSLALLLMMSGCSNTDNDMPSVGVTQIVSHTSLNTIRDSFTKEMKTLGYIDGENIEIDYKNAGNDTSALNSIMQNFKGGNKDVIVAIATPTAQAAAKYQNDIPVVFSAVSDPLQAGLLKDMKHPDKNITGTSDEIQVNQILDLAMSIQPEMKTLGFIYNSSEANSVSNKAKAKAYADKHGLQFEEIAVTSSNEVKQATDILTTKCDAIFAPNDNTIASAMKVLSKSCIDSSIPLYTGADSMVSDGGFASVGINYETLGQETARMVDQILKGEDIKSIPVKVFKEDLNIYINQKTADKLGIVLPDSVLNSDHLITMGD